MLRNVDSFVLQLLPLALRRIVFKGSVANFHIYPLDTPCVYSGFLPALLASFLFWPGYVLSVHDRCITRISNRAVYIHSVSSLGNRVN